MSITNKTIQMLMVQVTYSSTMAGEGNAPDHLPKRFSRPQPAATQRAVILQVLTLITKLLGSNLVPQKLQSSDSVPPSLSSHEKLEILEESLKASILMASQLGNDL